MWWNHAYESDWCNGLWRGRHVAGDYPHLDRDRGHYWSLKMWQIAKVRCKLLRFLCRRKYMWLSFITTRRTCTETEHNDDKSGKHSWLKEEGGGQLCPPPLVERGTNKLRLLSKACNKSYSTYRLQHPLRDVIHERINKHHNKLESHPNPLLQPLLQPVNTRKLKADSHIVWRSHAPSMPFPCHALPLWV